MNHFDATVVIPAYNERLSIQKTLELLSNLRGVELEVLVIVDSETDKTIEFFHSSISKPTNSTILVQNYGSGPANAIRYGIDRARAECVVVMMADGSDDARVIPELVNLVSRGVVVACASRYMSGGQQIGGPRFKRFLSKTAGSILHLLAGVGTHDPTNSFKAYSKSFIKTVGIDSRAGFEIGLELISKARRRRLPIAEIPTVWLDRAAGDSNFQLGKWIPQYFKWFKFCFGPEIRTKVSNRETDAT